MTRINFTDLLLAGGSDDPDLQRLYDGALEKGLSVTDLRHGCETEPEIAWDLRNETFTVNGVQTQARAAFFRCGALKSTNGLGATARDLAWHATVTAYTHLSEGVNGFNRKIAQNALARIPMLLEAKAIGLEIPETQITNNVIDYLERPFDYIAKPVCDGSSAMCLADVITELPDREWIKPSPAIIQSKLDYPEYRVFYIRGRLLVFKIRSKQIDYRRDTSASITHLATKRVSLDLAKKLHKLAQRLDIDFCAFDFKTNAQTGSWVFMQMNSSPSFSEFDKFCDDEICNSILEYLCGDVSSLNQSLDISHQLDRRSSPNRFID